MPYAEEAFSTLGDTTILEGRSISVTDVHDADLLAIRSTTKVDATLLDGSSVRFVGTATIGTDHLDKEYLESHNIHWCFSPGCNANSVSEYITTALLCLANRHNFTLKGKTIGVIGIGNVGSKVVKKAEALGMKVVQNDPPRQRAEIGAQGEEDGGQMLEIGGWMTPNSARHNLAPLPPCTSETLSPFCNLDTLLAESDIVTLHVPMTKEGIDKTYHLADAAFFARMKPGSIFINAARGAIVQTSDLMAAIESNHIAHAILDTWEGEPEISPDLLSLVDIGTPHIAGHSFEGKVAGTQMVYDAACRFLKIEPTWTPDALLPPPDVPEITVDASTESDEALLWKVVKQIYDIEADDSRLRAQTDDHAFLFDSLRKNYPIRREFRFTTIKLKNATDQLRDTFTKLGFCCSGCLSSD